MLLPYAVVGQKVEIYRPSLEAYISTRVKKGSGGPKVVLSFDGQAAPMSINLEKTPHKVGPILCKI